MDRPQIIANKNQQEELDGNNFVARKTSYLNIIIF